MRSDWDLQAYIEAAGVEAQIIQLEEEVRTVDQAAEAVGVEAGQIVKSLLFVAGDQPVMVIATGPERVNPAVIERFLGLSQGDLRLATPDQVLSFTGYAVGTVPPMAHSQEMEVLIDQSMMSLELVYAGGGSSSALLRISPSELMDQSGGQLIELSTPKGE